MRELSPHEIHAPKASPIFKGSSRADKLALFFIVFVVFVSGGAATWWYFQWRSSAAVDAAEGGLIAVQNANKNAVKNQNTSLRSGSNVLIDKAGTNADVLFLDTDNDSVLDDIEGLYGTDPKAKDSDNDGFSDGTELKSGYDPSNPASGTRMVDLSLVKKISEETKGILVLSSGLATGDRQRYYLAYDGASTSYYEADGTMKAQCEVGAEPTGTCATLPNELRTDFSRSFIDATISDAYHIPF